MPNKITASSPWYNVRVRASAPRAAEVFIYGDIGDSWYADSVTAAEFVRDIAALDVDAITVRINSYGGSVSDGIAIYNALKRHPAHITVSIDGVAVSIASLIAMAGDTVEMAENALLMIHAPWGGMYGNAAELREFADLLDTWAAAMATSYAAKTGRALDEMQALLTDGVDHWFTASQALDAKFIDATTTAMPVAASFDRAALAARFTSLSAVAAVKVPHAAAAAIHNSPEATMPKEVQAAQPAAASTSVAPAAVAPVASEADIQARALAADKQRRTDIETAFAKFSGVEGVSALMKTCADDHQCTVEQANTKLLAHLGSQSAPIAGGYVVTVADERDKFRAAIRDALLIRASLSKNDTANPYRSHTLFELARACLDKRGVNTGHMDKMGLVAAAFTHTGSDFPLLLANVAEKAMLKGYEEAGETFQEWTSDGVLTDFKPGSRVGLNDFPALDQVREGAEYKYATVGERGETIQLATYGKLFGITRQAIINDDLTAFTRIPRKMGGAAIRTVGDLVYAILTGNPNMADGVALFHATHANLLTAAAISTPGVDAMRVAMAKQTAGGKALNIRLANLLVPVALQGTAQVVATSEFEVGASSKNNTVPNSVRNTFKVIADARLDTASATNWYGAADPAVHDTIEVAYLDGNKMPVLEQQNGWNIDGVEFKVRLDAGVKALDHRTMAKNPNT
jgi:ATP-dependent protease ClpP protease subunit